MTRVRRALIATILAAVAIVAGAAGAAWAHGYRMYAVQTGSMAPSINPGDLVVDRPASGHYRVGQVVTFRPGRSNAVVTHRVVELGAQGLRTKGDANETADAGTRAVPEVVGEVAHVVPNGGYAVVYLQQPTGAASVVAGLTMLYFAWTLFFPPDPRRRTGLGTVQGRRPLASSPAAV